MTRKPARWRRARNPDKGGRYDTPMNNHIWDRHHGNDRELWRGQTHLVTLKPATLAGHWQYSVKISNDTSWIIQNGTEAQAKARARDVATKVEADAHPTMTRKRELDG